MQWRAGHKGFSIAAGTIESSKPHQMIVYLHSTLPHTTVYHSIPQYTTVYHSILQLYHSIPQYIQASLQLQENNVRRSYCTQPYTNKLMASDGLAEARAVVVVRLHLVCCRSVPNNPRRRPSHRLTDLFLQRLNSTQIPHTSEKQFVYHKSVQDITISVTHRQMQLEKVSP